MNSGTRHVLVSNGIRMKFLVGLLVIVSLQPAHAYVDPGTGAMMMQLAAAGLAGVAFYFRSFREWVFSLFRSTRTPTASSASLSDTSSDEK